MAKIRQILDDAKVGFQTAELRKVDAGGGGTIAYILANYVKRHENGNQDLAVPSRMMNWLKQID